VESEIGQQARQKDERVDSDKRQPDRRRFGCFDHFGKDLEAFYSHAVIIVQVQMLYERKIIEAKYAEKVPIGFIGRSALRLSFAQKEQEDGHQTS
jgi:hypothetical protein